MSTSLRTSLQDAAVLTFEQLVFLLPDSPPDELQRACAVSAVATVCFTGPAAGMLQVRACEGLLPQLTANMLGCDVVDEPLQLDALGEIANIICGQLFPRLGDSAFLQHPPEVEAAGESELTPAFAASAEIELGLDASRADVLLYLFDAG
jgi:hypothetical protein